MQSPYTRKRTSPATRSNGSKPPKPTRDSRKKPEGLPAGSKGHSRTNQNGAEGQAATQEQFLDWWEQTQPQRKLSSPLDRIPRELKELPQWLVWRLKHYPGEPKPKKVPFQPNSPTENANPTDPKHWSDFDTAVSVYREKGFSGIGFAFSPDDQYAGIDLDNCIDPETGETSPWAQEILQEVRSYSEISPSHTGIKIFLKSDCQLPPGSRHRRTIGQGGQIEVYTQGRYFTMTGMHFPKTPTGVRVCTEEFKKWYASVFGKKVTTSKSRSRSKPPPTVDANAEFPERENDPLSDEEVIRLASTCKDEEKRERFKRLFQGDISGYSSESEADQALCNDLAYYCGEDGHEQVERILLEKSGLIRDKWEREDYLRRTINLAYERRTDFHPKTKSNSVVRKFANSQVSKFVAPQLADEALYGIVGSIVREIEPHTEASLAALTFQLLTGIGNLIGRNTYSSVGADRHYGNLYVCLVGESARARKGSSWSYIQRILEFIDPVWARDRVTLGLSSGEGLIYEVRDDSAYRVKDKKTGKMVEKELTGVDDKRLLVTESEFARVLIQTNREANTLSAVLREAWDRGDLRTLTKNSPLRATGAHISVIGHITKDELEKTLGETQRMNGFANRFLWVHTQRSKLLPEGGTPDWQRLEELSQELGKAIIFARTSKVMSRDEKAKKLWSNEYPKLTADRMGYYGAVTSRAEAQVLRLSMIYALLDRRDVIREKHLQAALFLWKYCQDSALYIFGSSIRSTHADKIEIALRSRPDGMTRTEISNSVFNRNIKKMELDRALTQLEQAKLARKEVTRIKNHTVETWYPLPYEVTK